MTNTIKCGKGSIQIRDDKAEDYPVIGWIVTGAIWPYKPRLFTKMSDAKKYARHICKQIDTEFICPANVVIEWRTEESFYCKLEQSFEA
jgi:hypothetical protein